MNRLRWVGVLCLAASFRLLASDLEEGHHALELGEFGRAEPPLRRAVADLEKRPEDRPQLVMALVNLGSALSELGHPEEAEAALARALEIQQIIYPDGGVAAIVADHLAAVLLIEGKMDRAEKLLDWALPILRKGDRDLQPLLGEALGDLAKLKVLQGNLAAAEPVMQEACMIAEKAEADARTLADCWSDLATVYRLRGSAERAEPLLRRSLVVYQKLPGAPHPHISAIFLNLGMIELGEGKFGSAGKHFREAIEISRQAHGTDSLSVAIGEVDLARLYIAQGKQAEAVKVLTHALSVEEASGYAGQRGLRDGKAVLAAIQRNGKLDKRTKMSLGLR